MAHPLPSHPGHLRQNWPQGSRLGRPLVLIQLSNDGIFREINQPAIKGYPHDELETPKCVSNSIEILRDIMRKLENVLEFPRYLNRVFWQTIGCLAIELPKRITFETTKQSGTSWTKNAVFCCCIGANVRVKENRSSASRAWRRNHT